MKRAEVGVSAEELRIRVRGLAGPFSGIIEEAADEALAVSTDPELNRRLLLFKINGISVMQTALFNQDPLAALLDAWVLTAQMRLASTREEWADVAPEARRPLIGAVDRIETQLEELARLIKPTGDISEARRRVYEAAEETPIGTTFVTRRSTATELAEFSADTSPGLRSAVGQLSLGLGDVWARMDVYSAWLPKQARWQAELLVSQIASGEQVDGAFSDFSNLTRAIDDIAATVRETPDLVTGEREVILQALHAERIAALETLNQQFLAAVDVILERRIATAGSIVERERLAAIEALAAERVVVLDAIRAEREATVEELDAIVGGLAEDAMVRVVDHLFVRALQLLGVVVVLVVVGTFVYARFLRM